MHECIYTTMLLTCSAWFRQCSGGLTSISVLVRTPSNWLLSSVRGGHMLRTGPSVKWERKWLKIKLRLLALNRLVGEWVNEEMTWGQGNSWYFLICNGIIIVGQNVCFEAGTQVNVIRYEIYDRAFQVNSQSNSGEYFSKSLTWKNLWAMSWASSTTHRHKFFRFIKEQSMQHHSPYSMSCHITNACSDLNMRQ